MLKLPTRMPVLVLRVTALREMLSPVAPSAICIPTKLELIVLPMTFVLLLARKVQPAQEMQDACNGILGNRNRVNARGIGEDDVTLCQFRKQKLVNGSGGRVDPAELAG